MEAISTTEIFLRLLAALAAGIVVGWERESRGRPAGLRTTILTCLAAAVAMVISETLYQQSAFGAGASGSGAWRPDPARLGAGILTGIGFLGASTIIRQENFVRGVTTAASIWTVTVLGLAFGAGQWVVGGLGLGLTTVTLMLLPGLEKYIPSDWYATLRITVASNGPGEQALIDLVRTHGLRILSMKLRWDALEQLRVIELEVQCKKPQRFEVCSQTIAALSHSEGVLKADWS